MEPRKMQTVIRKVDVPAGRRIIAISDIHAHAHLFGRLLEKVKFSREDILFIVGDIIERGPDTLGTIRAVMELSRTHTVYASTGNWDFWKVSQIMRGEVEDLWRIVLERRRWSPSNMMDECCRELHLPLESAEDLARALPEIRRAFAAELDFLAGLPTMIETQDYIFVHGGIPTENTEELLNTPCRCFLKNDNFMRQGYSFSKYVIVGHWPVLLYCDGQPDFLPRIDRENRIIGIDGGCGVKRDGQLNALIISPDGEFSVESCDDFPVQVALERQEPSADPVAIHYGNAEVEVLARGEEFATVRHISSGRVMDVPTDYLYEWNGAWACEDIADALLDVQPGDRISILRHTSRGVYARKNGLAGWYLGALGDDPAAEGETFGQKLNTWQADY